MLSNFITNGIDTINIVYLWIALTKKNSSIFKFIFSVLILSISVTLIEQLELNFIITYIIDIIIIKFVYESSLKEVILAFLLVLLIDILFQLIFSIIIENVINNYTIRGIIVESIILISIVIFSKVNSLNERIRFEEVDNNILIYLISTCSVYAVIFKILWNYDNNLILNNLVIASILVGILVISQIIVYLYIVKIIKEKEKLKISNEYNVVIDEIVQEIKQRQHDFVNYKNTIRGIIEVVEDEDVKSAIGSYIKDEDIYDNKTNELIYIDNVIIRSIIYRNICKAKKYNINFEYKTENNVLDNILGYHELSNLLNNLLNNAFEEVLKDKFDKKNIEVKIFKLEKTSHLVVKNQIVNPNDININEMFTRGYSTKSADTRGYGLYNVQQIVNLHKGYIKIKIENEVIIFDIYFNNSSGKSGSP